MLLKSKYALDWGAHLQQPAAITTVKADMPGIFSRITTPINITAICSLLGGRLLAVGSQTASIIQRSGVLRLALRGSCTGRLLHRHLWPGLRDDEPRATTRSLDRPFARNGHVNYRYVNESTHENALLAATSSGQLLSGSSLRSRYFGHRRRARFVSGC